MRSQLWARVAVVSALLAVAFVTGAFAVWNTQVSAGGAVCVSAWHHHPGATYMSTGGEISPAERERMAEGCRSAGKPAWDRGRAIAVGGATFGIVSVTAFGMSRRRDPPAGEIGEIALRPSTPTV